MLAARGYWIRGGLIMIIMIVAESYSEYFQYRKRQFPYYSIGPTDKDFVYIEGDGDCNVARSLQRGNMYIHLSGAVPEWFYKRFTKLEIKDDKHHSFGPINLEDYSL